MVRSEKTGKVTYTPYEEETSITSEEQYNNITNADTLKWFRRLGGSETAQHCYTPKGYRITKLTSKSPCRTQQVVRKFNFDI